MEKTMEFAVNWVKSAVIVLGMFSMSIADAENISLYTEEEAAAILTRGNNRFALELYREVHSLNNSENLFFSPYSISTAMGMTYAGARGETAAEMARVLHFELPLSRTCRAFHRISEEISSATRQNEETGGPFVLTVSNGIWVQEDLELLFPFASTVKT
ncbi:MAG: serpin family protein, partial [bacterium]|nr:serpin family protein [bacterium]